MKSRLVPVVMLGAGLCLAPHDARAQQSPPAPASAAERSAEPRCGNGRLEPPETCDDGNTTDGDDCPSSCRIERCDPADARVDVAVDLAYPRESRVGGVVVLLDYPEGVVSIPGRIGEPSVGGRVSHVPKNFTSSAFDLDYALREAVLLNQPLPAGEIFRVSFDRCKGADVPRVQEFRCRVEQASTPDGHALATDALTCAARVP